MNPLAGKIHFDRALATDDFWLSEPFSRPQAFVDLVLLANNRPGLAKIRDVDVPVERGQLARSQVRLAERWKWSPEKVVNFLKQYQDARKLSFVSNKITTLITILDFDLYSPPVLTGPDEPETTPEPASEPGTRTASEPGTEPARKGERGKGIGNREVPPLVILIPDDREVERFCAEYRDMVRGVDSGIPELWWRGWLANMLSREKFPQDWKRVLKLDFTKDFIARHWKAIGKKNGGDVSDGRSAIANSQKNNGDARPSRTPAQKRFELQRELEQLRESLATLYYSNIEPDPADEKREKVLEAELKALEESERTDGRPS